MTAGAIDVGGTKIESRLFDAGLRTIATRRVPTPAGDFESFVAALEAETRWLLDGAGNPALPVGIGLPGLMDPSSGLCFAANLPISGRNVRAELVARLGRPIVFGHDCLSFAYSEAHGGAGEDFETVVGLIMGTGLAAGVCIDGRIPPRHNGMALEIGHVGVPGRLLERLHLPLRTCGCGKPGCFEAYVSGPGLAALARHELGVPLSPPELAARAAADDAGARRVLGIWTDLAAECLLTLQLLFDPDCVVLGGGLSRMTGIMDLLAPALAERRLGHARPPVLRLADHGDSSGARGMALLALHGDRP